jgi:hypothetical protein
MSRIPHRFRRTGIVLASLAGAFAIALTAPIPAMPDAGRATVRAEIDARLPGWTVARLQPSWEGAYAVVTSCAGREVAFQLVPGHGLPHDDAWLQPNNDYARRHLRITSDHERYLLWRGNPVGSSALSCADDIAQAGDNGDVDPDID